MGSSTDQDWYSYEGEDSFGCTTNPAVDFEDDISVCMYADCVSGATVVDCTDDATPSTDSSGLSGCCHTASFELNLSCPSWDDSADIYIQVESTVGECLPYTLSYHY